MTIGWPVECPSTLQLNVLEREEEEDAVVVGQW